MKAKAKFYKGIEYIVVGELPFDQQTLLAQRHSTPERIKIMVEGKIVNNCINYQDYSHWFHATFKKAPSSKKDQTVLVNIAINKV